MLSRTSPSNHSCELLLAHLVLKGANLSVTLRPKKNDTLVSGNAGDKKNLNPGGCKTFFCHFN